MFGPVALRELGTWEAMFSQEFEQGPTKSLRQNVSAAIQYSVVGQGRHYQLEMAVLLAPGYVAEKLLAVFQRSCATQPDAVLLGGHESAGHYSWEKNSVSNK